MKFLTQETRVFTVETDASRDDIGAILTQQGKLVAFMSRALGVAK
jgi:hypothetical protein